MDYSQLAFPKGRTPALAKQDKQAALEAQDKKENQKAKKRAKGFCEVVDVYGRCARKDVHTHHLLGGMGRRNRGVSVLASMKIRVCQTCHNEIHAKILKPTTEKHDAATVRFRREK